MEMILLLEMSKKKGAKCPKRTRLKVHSQVFDHCWAIYFLFFYELLHINLLELAC